MAAKQKTDRGREFLGAIIVSDAQGKPLEGEPKKGPHTIAMRPGVKFAGGAEGAIKELVKSFPGCTFSWSPGQPA